MLEGEDAKAELVVTAKMMRDGFDAQRLEYSDVVVGDISLITWRDTYGTVPDCSGVPAKFQ